MFLVNKKFLKPTKDARLVAILENLRTNPEISQAELGTRALISSARVNSFLKELQGQDIIKVERLNGKSYKYLLTKKGQDIRQKLMGEYMAEIVQVYSALKENIQDKLIEILDKGYEKIACFGASSTCEVVLSCLSSLDLRVIALVDNDEKKQGTLFFGHVVSPPVVLKFIGLDAILITSFGKHEEIRQDIFKIIPNKRVEVFNL